MTKTKKINTEFTVYYQDLENLQTSSQLQVFRHKPVQRRQDWPVLIFWPFPSGKIWRVKRSNRLEREWRLAHSELHSFQRVEKNDRLIWFAYRGILLLKQTLQPHTHNVLHGEITSQPASRICWVLLITNHKS